MSPNDLRTISAAAARRVMLPRSRGLWARRCGARCGVYPPGGTYGVWLHLYGCYGGSDHRTFALLWGSTKAQRRSSAPGRGVS